MKYCNKLGTPTHRPLCYIVINREDPSPPIPYYVIYGQPLTLFSPIWFVKLYWDLQIDVSPWRSQLVAYSPQPSKPTKSHCCRQGKRRCVPNMKHRMQNTNTNSTPEQTLKRFSKKNSLRWTSKSTRGIFPTTTKSKHRGILLLTMDGEKTVYA